MTVADRQELRAAITDAVERFGWWEVLYDVSQVLRKEWNDALVANNKPKQMPLVRAAHAVEEAIDAVKEIKGK